MACSSTKRRVQNKEKNRTEMFCIISLLSCHHPSPPLLPTHAHFSCGLALFSFCSPPPLHCWRRELFLSFVSTLLGCVQCIDLQWLGASSHVQWCKWHSLTLEKRQKVKKCIFYFRAVCDLSAVPHCGCTRGSLWTQLADILLTPKPGFGPILLDAVWFWTVL